jgi:hypothetical protein
VKDGGSTTEYTFGCYENSAISVVVTETSMSSNESIDFLDGIRNSDTGDFEDIVFSKFSGITASMFMEGNYITQVLFFDNNISYAFYFISKTTVERDKMFYRVKSSIIFK